ncbi:DNA primase/helicase [Sphingomonas phage Kimi]|nr:DNA primase/helicase [Sphingomonas phage Kimi]
MFENIPDEMKPYRQWVVWRLEETDGDKPTKVPYCPTTGTHASVTKPETWVDFATALAAMETGYWNGIGFVLTEADPFCFIDLDDPWQTHPSGAYKYTNPQTVYERQQRVYSGFNTFAELSPSGKGLHLILKGAVPRGRKREAIEIYSSQRFMTMTGNVYRAGEITGGHDALLDVLWQQMGGPAQTYQFEGGPEKEEDAQVISRALSAENGDKFKLLLDGDWTGLYSSQSEADFAFVDIVAFYTDNREQIRRIFLNSPLAERPKAKRRDYQEYMINKSFDRKLPPIDTEGLRLQFEEMIAAQNAKAVPVYGAGTNHEDTSIAPAPTPETQPGGSASGLPVTYAPAPAAVKGSIPLPPGLVGMVAQFIYDQAPRPVMDIALIGALGLMAGIAGRAYNVSGTGLNGYFMLIAKTGTGKEAINSGISKLMTATKGTIESGCPAALEFVGPSEIASAPALLKALGRNPCFVSVAGEFGLKLKQLSDERASSHEIGLRRVLLDLFAKSGQGNILNPMIYSDKDKNTPAILSPAFSMIGESTPERFYEALNESMVTEGLLPRFTTIEYHGERPDLAVHHTQVHPSFQLVDMMRTLCVQCMEVMAKNSHINIETDYEAQSIGADFNRYCDGEIRGTNKDAIAQLWNRAHLKALKLAALVAVGENPYNPVITGPCMNWAINIIVRDVVSLTAKFEAGEIGSPHDQDEIKQVREIARVVMSWFTNNPEQAEKYGVTGKHIAMKVFPYSAIQRRTAAVACFRKDKRGATRSLKETLQIMCDLGLLTSMSKKQHGEMFGSEMVGYMVANPSLMDLRARGRI